VNQIDIGAFAHLSRFRAIGDDRFIACCPAHDDRSPSLSGVQRGGKLLLRCHAGCTVAAILQAMGLNWCALFADGGNHHHHNNHHLDSKKKIESNFRKWRQSESRRLGEELRCRDIAILSIDDAVVAGTLSEGLAMERLAQVYDRYSELEYQCDVLVKGTDREALEIYRNG
jgi:hypothetical protein